MALYDHEGTRGLAPLSILGQPPGWLSMPLIRKKSTDYKERSATAPYKGALICAPRLTNTKILAKKNKIFTFSSTDYKKSA